MSRRNLINLVLLGIVAVLVAVVVYEPGIEEEQAVKLTALERSEVKKITINRIGTAQVILEKEQDRWFMREPYAMPANAFKVEAIIEMVAAQSHAQYPIAGQDLQPYGLDKPRVTVVFNENEKIDFGGIEPLKQRRYMRYHDTLHVVTDRFFHNISVSETDYLDHNLFPDKSQISKLVLPELTLTLKDGQWQTEPQVEGYSNDQGNELIDNWLYANAVQMTDYKPGQPAQQVKVYREGQDDPIVFDVLREADTFSLGRADLGLQYKFTAAKEQDLLRLPAKIPAETIDPPADVPAAGENK